MICPQCGQQVLTTRKYLAGEEPPAGDLVYQVHKIDGEACEASFKLVEDSSQ